MIRHYANPGDAGISDQPLMHPGCAEQCWL